MYFLGLLTNFIDWVKSFFNKGTTCPTCKNQACSCKNCTHTDLVEEKKEEVKSESKAAILPDVSAVVISESVTVKETTDTKPDSKVHIEKANTSDVQTPTVTVTKVEITKSVVTKEATDTKLATSNQPRRRGRPPVKKAADAQQPRRRGRRPKSK